MGNFGSSGEGHDVGGAAAGRDNIDGVENPDLVQGLPKEDTLQYLSQLESVARRLKDQLLNEQPKVATLTNDI